MADWPRGDTFGALGSAVTAVQDDKSTSDTGIHDRDSVSRRGAVLEGASDPAGGETFADHLTIRNRRGLHLRAATQIVRVASQFDCTVIFEKGSVTAGAKSVVELLVLRAVCGARLRVVASGRDARACVAAMSELVADGFGEPV